MMVVQVLELKQGVAKERTHRRFSFKMRMNHSQFFHKLGELTQVGDLPLKVIGQRGA